MMDTKRRPAKYTAADVERAIASGRVAWPTRSQTHVEALARQEGGWTVLVRRGSESLFRREAFTMTQLRAALDAAATFRRTRT